MQAKTLIIVGIRLLAALSFIRTIDSIALWTAEQQIRTAISFKASALTIAVVPIIIGLFLWIAAPKLVALFGVENDATPNQSKPLDKQSILTIGLICIGVLTIMNALPVFLMICLEAITTDNAIDWLLAATPLLKITLCLFLIFKANSFVTLFTEQNSESKRVPQR